MKQNLAFTIIELLVVVAIIAILAALLFPVFDTAREKARQTTCLSNEKHMGLAFLQYAQDYDEFLPQPRPVYVSPTNYTTWDEVIAPYVHMGNQYSFVGPWSWMTENSAPWEECPDDTISHAEGNPSVPLNGRDYSMVGSSSSTAVGSSGQLLANIPDTSGTFLLVEMFDHENNVGDYHDTSTSCPDYQWTQTTNSFAPGPHTNGWSYLYCDGHAKWMLPEKTLGAGGVLSCTGNGPLGPWTLNPND